MTFVSVVIPAFDAAATLSATLESVVRQTHRDIEVLVVDDFRVHQLHLRRC